MVGRWGERNLEVPEGVRAKSDGEAGSHMNVGRKAAEDTRGEGTGAGKGRNAEEARGGG